MTSVTDRPKTLADAIDAVETGTGHQSDVVVCLALHGLMIAGCALGPACGLRSQRQSALACCTDAAAESWMRMAEARRLKAGRAAGDTGTACAWWAMVIGSW